MITRIHIENYVLIDHLDMAFEPGLNTVTGETGAGKSILLGAIGMLLGGRAEGGAVKDPSRNCVAEAVFALKGSGLEAFFETLDLEYADETVIRRVVTPAGKSRTYVNDLPVQLAALKALAPKLIDIHSQHQTLLLGSDDFRMEVVDGVSGAQPALQAYRETYDRWRQAETGLEELCETAAKARQEEAFIRFQYDQLAAAALREDEQSELERQEQELAHAEEIREALYAATRLLDEDDENILTQLRSVGQTLRKIAGVSPAAAELASRAESALYELRDVAAEVSAAAERIDSDPARLGEVRVRLDFLYTLQQKHRLGSVAELIALRDEYKARLDAVEHADEEIADRRREVEMLEKETRAKAAELSAVRMKAADPIERYVTQQLRALGMEHAVLQVAIDASGPLGRKGADTVEFLFCANKGGRLEKIEKAASGGEMSRLMLALKSLLARHKHLPAIVFDEIDTGVSGRVADKMGGIMRELSESMQVVCITHLPQVAAKGDHHFLVYKTDEGGKTATVIRKLAPDERIQQIAAMLSGSTVTAAARAQAEELLKN